jgi:uncharacterized protein (DUF362 family)
MTSRVVVSYVESRSLDALRHEIRAVLQSLLDCKYDNPLSALVERGQSVLIKPNMVRHYNPKGALDAVVTAPEVCQVLAELADDAVGSTGNVLIADSPQNDCDFSLLLQRSGWEHVFQQLQEQCRGRIELLDMRPESVVMRDGVIVERRRLPGDPLGEESIKLGEISAFQGSGIDPSRLRGSDYDPSVTTSSHADGSHTYSICRSFLFADMLIVVPKVKTHKKVGLSLAMKNIVGIVGEKNCLPHHTAGFPFNGGDEYPSVKAWPLARQWAIERARPLLAAGRWTPFFRGLRKAESALLPEIVQRSGNWWGNDTAWRMVVDLVSILRQRRSDLGKPTLFVYEGLTAGAGEGPLAPDPVELGLLAASMDPVAGDWCIAKEIGFEPSSAPLLRQAAARRVWSAQPWAAPEVRYLNRHRPSRVIEPHPGWRDAPLVDVNGADVRLR